MSNSIFSSNLKKLRKKFGYTQEEFAEIIGYSSKNVSKWETGQSIPNIDILNNICEIFRIANVSELIKEPIEYYQFDIDEDYSYCQNHSVNICKKAIEFYYLLIKNDGYIKIIYNDEIFEFLAELERISVVNEYTINQTHDEMFIRYSLNINYSSDRTLRNILTKKSYETVNFANDSEYMEYISNLKIPKQVMFVLDFIENFINESFSLSDLYDERLVKTLREHYGKNKDYKKIIRTCLAKICEYGIITKVGYALYNKKHHTVKNIIDLDDSTKKRIDSILKLRFEGYSFDLSYPLEMFDELKRSKEELGVLINNYMIFLRNISLITDFLVEIDNESVKIKYCVE